MNADDDGFCEHFTVMRMTESKPDDLKILQAKGFVFVFDDMVLVIIDWKENNYLRSDRYTPSKYMEIYKEELKKLPNNKPECLPSGTPEVDSGKVRIDKVRLDKDSIGKNREEKTLPLEIISLTQKLYDSLEKPTRWETKPPDLIKWGEEISKLHRIDGVSFELIESVIEHIARHDRWKWREVLQSGYGFRKHFDTIEKQMPKNKNQTAGEMQNDVDYFDKKIKEMGK